MLLSTHRVAGLILAEHRFDVPLDHARPDGERLSLFAREVRADENGSERRPWLAFFQGGPGMGATRPLPGQQPWIDRAVRDYRLLLLDQRGTGVSSTVNRQTLARLPTPEAQAAFLRHFRADSIVLDAELVRREAAGDEPWTVLGQSFGGFCVCTYLSLAPEGLRGALVTAGLPPLAREADDVYRATYPRVADRNRRYYDRYPQDVDRMRALVGHLAEHDVRLPDGERLSPRRFLQAGLFLGMSDGFEKLHYVVEQAFVEGARGPEVGFPFLRALGQLDEVDAAPIFSVLHEPIYAQGRATRWAAERLRPEFPEFGPDADPPFFTGEMVYPWMFEEYRELRPLRASAELLAAHGDWPPLYDLDRLRVNEVPVAAVVFEDDMYVERAYSEETAGAIRGLRLWLDDEHHHDALRVDGEAVLDRLLSMLADGASG